MSGNDNIERELESFLREDESRVAALYRKLPRVEPDAKLDAAVLTMARRAVATKRERSRWLPALSAAAVVLFAAGLAYRVGPQVWNDRGESTRPSAQSVMEKKVSPPAESASAPQAAAAPVPSAARDAEAFPAVKTAKQQYAPEPQPAVAGMARQKTAEGKIAPKPAPAPAMMQEMRADRISGGAAQAPASPTQSTPLQSLDATIFPGKEQEKSEADANRAASLKDKSAEVRSETALTTMSDALAQPPSAAPARAVSAPAPSASAAAAAAADPNIRLYPESWVANIQKMLRENHREDAIKSLGEFRKKYPSYRLPDDLRDLK